ncbi:MAG: lipopolysaccharide heptosyltransferase II [Candidatus Omnitrophota bacterium]
MNILQVLPELNVGGVETGTLDLAKYMVGEGHKAVVVSGGGVLVKELEESGAVHYELPVHKKSLFSIIKCIPRLKEIIRREEIDIVHARSRIPAWIAYFASRGSAAVFVTTCHGYYSKQFLSSVMGWGRRVIVSSNVVARHMIDDFGVEHERIRLIPRSVDLEKFKYRDPAQKRKEEFHVGIIGRITPLKGHPDFIRAMSRVSRAVLKLKIWIVGDVPAARQVYKEQLQALVRRQGLWNCTEFLGTQRDIPGILSQLDLLVLASVTHETFGRVIIEAQACGVPVVATKVGGVVDIIENNVNGLLVPPADPAAMASAAIRVFEDKELARFLAQNAYKKILNNYTLEQMAKSTLDVYREALGNRKILIIKTSSLGDIILSTAAIREIRKKFLHNYKISLLVAEEFKELLLACPYIDELIVADFKNKDKGLAGLIKLAGVLRRKSFDMVIDLQNNRKSHILSFLSGGPLRYGYDNGKFGFLINHSIKDEKPGVDPLRHQFRILEMLGIEFKDARLELWLSKEDYRHIEELLNSQWLTQNQRIVGINLSASRRWVSKSWPRPHIVKLCQELAGRDMRVVITGSEDDAEEAGALIGAVKNIKLINACGKTTVNQLACLIKKCCAYICVDSAPLHIAAAMGVPTVALFGPTDPRRHLPPVNNCVVLKKNLACSPCYKSKCRHKECMELIKPQEVLEAVDRLLKL